MITSEFKSMTDELLDAFGFDDGSASLYDVLQFALSRAAEDKQNNMPTLTEAFVFYQKRLARHSIANLSRTTPWSLSQYREFLISAWQLGMSVLEDWRAIDSAGNFSENLGNALMSFADVEQQTAFIHASANDHSDPVLFHGVVRLALGRADLKMINSALADRSLLLAADWFSGQFENFDDQAEIIVTAQEIQIKTAALLPEFDETIKLKPAPEHFAFKDAALIERGDDYILLFTPVAATLSRLIDRIAAGNLHQDLLDLPLTVRDDRIQLTIQAKDSLLFKNLEVVLGRLIGDRGNVTLAYQSEAVSINIQLTSEASRYFAELSGDSTAWREQLLIPLLKTTFSFQMWSLPVNLIVNGADGLPLLEVAGGRMLSTQGIH